MNLEYYKPTSKAWIAASILFLVIAAIVYFVTQADITFKFQNAIGIELDIGAGSQDINVYNVTQGANYGA
jgi:hypothetical protein